MLGLRCAASDNFNQKAEAKSRRRKTSKNEFACFPDFPEFYTWVKNFGQAVGLVNRRAVVGAAGELHAHLLLGAGPKLCRYNCREPLLSQPPCPRDPH